MRKATPLIIFELIEFSGRTCSSRHHKAFLAKASWQSHAKMSLLSAPGSVVIKTTLMKSLAEVLWYTQTVFLSKQVLPIVAARRRDVQTIEVLASKVI